MTTFTEFMSVEKVFPWPLVLQNDFIFLSAVLLAKPFILSSEVFFLLVISRSWSRDACPQVGNDKGRSRVTST